MSSSHSISCVLPSGPEAQIRKPEQDHRPEDVSAASPGDQGPGSQQIRLLTLPGNLECVDLHSKIIAFSMSRIHEC